MRSEPVNFEPNAKGDLAKGEYHNKSSILQNEEVLHIHNEMEDLDLNFSEEKKAFEDRANNSKASRLSITIAAFCLTWIVFALATGKQHLSWIGLVALPISIILLQQSKRAKEDKQPGNNTSATTGKSESSLRLRSRATFNF